MFKLLLLLCCSFSLFAQSASITADSAVYPINVSQRGAAIVNMFNSLVSANPSYSPNYTIGIQTTVGFIQPVQSIVSTTNSTILIVNYGTSKSFVNQTTVVLFVENIVELVYNNNIFSSNMMSYVPGIPLNTVPYYTIDPSLRTVDIQDAFTILSTGQYYQTTSKVSMQTTLTGTFYGTITHGLIPNMQSVNIAQTGNALFLVGYPKNAYIPSYVVVEPDQVVAIFYTKR